MALFGIPHTSYRVRVPRIVKYPHHMLSLQETRCQSRASRMAHFSHPIYRGPVVASEWGGVAVESNRQSAFQSKLFHHVVLCAHRHINVLTTRRHAIENSLLHCSWQWSCKRVGSTPCVSASSCGSRTETSSSFLHPRACVEENQFASSLHAIMFNARAAMSQDGTSK